MHIDTRSGSVGGAISGRCEENTGERAASILLYSKMHHGNQGAVRQNFRITRTGTA